MILSVRGCVDPITHLPRLKVKVTVQGRDLPLKFVSPPYPLKLFNVFSLISYKCSQWDDVQNPWLVYADSRSRSHFKVMGSISPQPFEWFSFNITKMFLLLRRCAELMTLLCWLKVTVQGHEIHPWIYVCPKSPQPFEWFSLNHPNVSLSEMVCRANDSATQTKGQDHTSRPWDLHLNFV